MPRSSLLGQGVGQGQWPAGGGDGWWGRGFSHGLAPCDGAGWEGGLDAKPLSLSGAVSRCLASVLWAQAGALTRERQGWFTPEADLLGCM